MQISAQSGQKPLSSLESIRALVNDDLMQLDVLIDASAQVKIDLIPEVVRYIVESGGKRFRPMLTMLSARALGCEGERHIAFAAIIEFIHTATLLHDDVVDVSDMRRGRPTANVVWGNSASILVGDFLYSRAFQMINSLRNWQVSDILANTTGIIAEGEALQLTNRHNPDVTDAYYFEVIRCKTAVLFAAAAQLGAIAADVSAEVQNAMYAYGLHLGMGFQIMDDVLDYMVSAEEMGKNAGDDLCEGKVTLPLIYAMKYASPVDIKTIQTAVREGGLEAFSAVLKIIQQTPALDDIKALAHQELQKAELALDVVPNSIYKEALLGLAELAVERRR